MIQKMLVESWDGRSKIFAELDVIEKIAEDKVIVHLWGNNYKELTLNPKNSVWYTTREDVVCGEKES